VLSTSVPWPALRHELAWEKRAAVVSDQNGRVSVSTHGHERNFSTLAPNVGPRLSGQSLEDRRTVVTDERDLRKAPELMDAGCRDGMVEFYDEFSDARDMTMSEFLSEQNDPFSCKKKDIRPQSAPVSWTTAITTRVNALWKSFHERSALPMPVVDKTNEEHGESTQPPLVEFASLGDRTKQPLTREEPVALVDVGQQETTEKRLATDGVWRIDSDIEINLGRPHDSRPAADLDLRIRRALDV